MSEPFLTRRITLGGRRLVIDAPAGDAAFARYGRSRFRDYRALCRAVLGPRSSVIDIGANIGLTSLLAAEIASEGTVLAIEGAPRNFAALSRNLAAHGAGRASAVHCAVGATEGEIAFIDNSAFGHVQTADYLGKDRRQTKVPLRRLDDIVAERDLTAVDLIKIDIEGFEFEALSGSRETLARFDPVVFLEFNSYCQIALFDGSPRRFLEWLLEHFSELHLWHEGALESVHEMGPLRFLQRHMAEHRCNDDLVATNDPKRFAGVARAVPARRRKGGVGGWLGRLRG